MVPILRCLAVSAAVSVGVVSVAGCGPENTAAPAAPPQDMVLVTRVVDGDTFEVSDGRTVRVLGIDSCEARTPGGQAATAQAEGLLRNNGVVLTTEPGVDLDPYGRQLRYVALARDGQDYGKLMVPAQHTGLYATGQAGPARVADLTALDGTPPRVCGDEPAPTTTSAPPEPVQDEPDPDPDVDRPRTYVPAPDPEPRRDTSSDDDSGSAGTKPRSGQSGHPCGPSERDGDNDGYCGEGR